MLLALALNLLKFVKILHRYGVSIGCTLTEKKLLLLYKSRYKLTEKHVDVHDVKIVQEIIFYKKDEEYDLLLNRINEMKNMCYLFIPHECDSFLKVMKWCCTLSVIQLPLCGM